MKTFLGGAPVIFLLNGSLTTRFPLLTGTPDFLQACKLESHSICLDAGTHQAGTQASKVQPLVYTNTYISTHIRDT